MSLIKQPILAQSPHKLHSPSVPRGSEKSAARERIFFITQFFHLNAIAIATYILLHNSHNLKGSCTGVEETVYSIEYLILDLPGTTYSSSLF